MTFVRFSRGLAIACGLGFGAAGVALAQDAPPPPPAAHAPGAWGQGQDHHGQWGAHRRGEHERLLHDALALRPDQEAAWATFKASMGPSPEDQARRQDWAQKRGQQPGERPHLTTPERLDKMSARMAEHQAAFQRHAAAVKAFYAVLSPQQQRTFDALSALGGHGGMRHGWGRGGEGPRPG